MRTFKPGGGAMTHAVLAAGDFTALADMTPVRGFFVANLRGQLADPRPPR